MSDKPDYTIGVGNIQIARLMPNGEYEIVSEQPIELREFAFPQTNDKRTFLFDVRAIIPTVTINFKLLTLKQWQFFDLMLSKLIWKRKDK